MAARRPTPGLDPRRARSARRLDASGLDHDTDLLAGTLDIDSDEGSSPGIRLEDLRADLESGQLGRLTIQQASPSTFRIAIDAVDVPTWLERVAPTARQRGILPPGFSVSGSLSSTATFVLESPGAADWSLEGTVTLADGGFASDDGSRVAEGLGAEVVLDLESTDGAVDLSGEGTLRGPIVLWQTAFGDYSQTTLDLDLSGHLTPVNAQGRRGIRSTAALAPEGDFGGTRIDLDLAGEWTTEGFGGLEVSGGVGAHDLEAAYGHLVAQPFAGSPWVESIKIAGSGRVALDAWRPAERSFRGALILEAVDLGAPGDPFTVSGLDLELPFNLTVPTTGPTTGPALTGSLAFHRLEASGLPFSSTATPLRIEGDTIGIIEPLDSRVAGGVLGLEDLRIASVLTPERRLETALNLRGLVLEDMTAALGLPAFDGTLDGQVPRVRLTASAFDVDGDAVLNTLGGSIRVFDITGRDFFSRFPRITFSADLESIDLERLSGVFAFGRVSGTIDGEVRQCTLVKAQPVACTARIDSTEGRREKRWIDVEAVNNISVLGTGGGLQGGLARRFLSRFTYDKLGASVRLADDRFLLRGLVRRGDRELFLKGRLPFPIDVVNGDPGATISFQVMLDRLRNFDQARIESGRPAPETPPPENRP